MFYGYKKVQGQRVWINTRIPQKKIISISWNEFEGGCGFLGIEELKISAYGEN